MPACNCQHKTFCLQQHHGGLTFRCSSPAERTGASTELSVSAERPLYNLTGCLGALLRLPAAEQPCCFLSC